MKINSKSTINLIDFFVRQLVTKDFFGPVSRDMLDCLIFTCLDRLKMYLAILHSQ